MKTIQKILYFFVLPFVATLLYPPATLIAGTGAIVVALITFGLIGWAQLRGRSLALTFAIFLQGLNVIIRLMMFFAHAVPKGLGPDWVYIITVLAGLGLSMWLVIRLDQSDVRVTMTA